MKQERRLRSRSMSWYETNGFLRDHLLNLRGEFIRMRDSFGVGPEVGFAQLSLGSSGTPAFVAETSLAGGIPSRHVLRQIVKPELTRSLCKIVTFALPEQQYAADPRLTIAFFKNQKAIVGFVAHELAHCVLEIEPEINNAIDFVLNNLDCPTNNARYQAQTDLLASIFGYSEEVLEALSAWLNLIKQTKTGSRKEIKETRFRIKAVKRFQRI